MQRGLDEFGNQHPADELAFCRQKIRELKDQEKILREQLLELPPAERTGVYYEAKVQEQVVRRLSADLLEAELGDIRRFYKNTVMVKVLIGEIK